MHGHRRLGGERLIEANVKRIVREVEEECRLPLETNKEEILRLQPHSRDAHMCFHPPQFLSLDGTLYIEMPISKVIPDSAMSFFFVDVLDTYINLCLNSQMHY